MKNITKIPCSRRNIFISLSVFALVVLNNYDRLLKKPIGGQLFENDRFDTQKLRYYTQATLTSNTWLFNENIFQYSTTARLIRGSVESKIEIESLVYFRHQPSPSTQNFINAMLKKQYCLVKFNGNEGLNEGGGNDSKLVLLEYNDLVMLGKNKDLVFYSIKCALDFEQNNRKELDVVNSIQVAIIDPTAYRKANHGAIFFHKPNIVTHKGPKLQTKTVNCVHTLRDVNTDIKYKHLKNWLRINQLMGVGRIRLCIMTGDKSSEPYENRLKDLVKLFGKDFIDVVEYESNPRRLCDKLKNSTNKLSDSWRDLCVQTIENDFSHIGTHENTCDMECLHNYKHAYQYMTNYDVDEFIFPRRFSKNHFNDLENIRDLKCDIYPLNDGTKKAMYGNNMMHEYIQRLTGIYGNRVAYFHFQNYQVLNEHENLLDKISSNVFIQKTGGTQVYLDYENTNRSTNLRFWFKNCSKVDHAYLDSFKTLSDEAKCFQKLIFRNTSELDSKWRNVLMSLLNNRNGKSIFNTDYVLSLNPHTAHRIKPDSFRVDVPIDIGYASHFRDEDISTLESSNQKANIMSFPLRHLVFDMEYFLFIVRKFL
jgi:hypothetical protein